MIEDLKVLETLNKSKIARLATVDPDNNQPYLVPVVFVFNGYNIYIPIDAKPKTVNSNQLKRVKIYKKIPIVISSLLSLECGTQIIRDLKKY